MNQDGPAPQADARGRVIAAFAARGGAGASTLAAEIAQALAAQGERALLIDLDLAFGGAALAFNQSPKETVAQALAEPAFIDAESLARLAAPCGAGVSLIASPAEPAAPAPAAQALTTLLEGARGAWPWVVIDAPRTWSIAGPVFAQADEILLIAEPCLMSLRNAKAAALAAARANPKAALRLVLNKTGLPGRREIAPKRFAKAFGAPVEAVLPFDAPLFGRAADAGRCVSELAPTAKASRALTALAQSLRPACAARP